MTILQFGIATTPSVLVDRATTPKHSYPNQKILHDERRIKDMERKNKIEALSKKIHAYDHKRESFRISTGSYIQTSSITSVSSVAVVKTKSKGLRNKDRVMYRAYLIN